MCFMCVASIIVKRLWMWSMCVCMDRLYLWWNITHIFPIGEIGWTGNKSCKLLILLGMFTSVNKNSVISAFMGFIWRVTSLRPRRWSSQRVKWRRGRTETQTLPPPSLSPPISLTSWSPLLSLTLPHFLSQRSPWHDLLKVQFIIITVTSLWEYGGLQCYCFIFFRFVLTSHVFRFKDGFRCPNGKFKGAVCGI